MHRPIKKNSKKRDDYIVEPLTPYNPSQYIVKYASPSPCSPDRTEEETSSQTNYGSVLDFMTKDMLDDWVKLDEGKQSPSFHPPEKEVLSQLISYLWNKLDEKNEVLERLKAEEEASSIGNNE